jgi:hypothetical protein
MGCRGHHVTCPFLYLSLFLSHTVDETRIACTTKLGLQIVLVDLKVLR